MSQELELIERELVGKQTQDVCGVKFTTGVLRGREVVLARTGIGKVNAAMTATLLVSTFRPREVVFSGIAGGISESIHPGDIVIAERTAQHDYGDVTEKGFAPQMVKDPKTGQRVPMFYPADERLLAMAQAVAGKASIDKIHTTEGDRQPIIRTGVVVTGDVFVASAAKKDELRKTFSADAVEMEGAAVAQVCQRLGVPCLIVRSISDLADPSANVDVRSFMRTACTNSATLVMDLVKALADRPTTAPATNATSAKSQS